MAQLMDVELRGVDDDVSELADRLHQGPLVRQAFAHGIVFAEGMRTAGLAVAAEQSVLVRFDKNQSDGVVFF